MDTDTMDKYTNLISKAEIINKLSKSVFVRVLNDRGPTSEIVDYLVKKYPTSRPQVILNKFGDYIYKKEIAIFNELYEVWKKEQLEKLEMGIKYGKS